MAAHHPLRSFTTTNFYAGSELNRLSWLREEDAFLNRAIAQCQVVLLHRARPLVHAQGDCAGRLATLPWSEIAPRLRGPTGSSVFGAAANGIAIHEKETGAGAEATEKKQDKEEAEKEEKSNRPDPLRKATQGLVPPGLALVLLGTHEPPSQTTLPGREPSGVPYFALSVSYVPPGVERKQERTAPLLAWLEGDERFEWEDTRRIAFSGTWPLADAAMVAQATSLLDWNERNQFCPSCARRQYSLWAGYKRTCASALDLPAARQASWVEPLLQAPGQKTPCPSTLSLHNFSYPRTDPVTIMAAIHPDGEHILLGRKKAWPEGQYSCLAGFVEPGESVEDAVRREVQEEAGVKIGQVYYHSSQPWPFPANLMLGAFGQAVPGGEAIRLDLDNELEDARFFSRGEVLGVLERPGGSMAPDAPLRFPGPTAIAHTLIRAWAHNQALLPPPLKQKI